MTSAAVPDQVIESMFEVSAAAIVAVDRADRVTAWNPAAERLFGWTAREVVGQRYPLVPDDDGEVYRAALQGVLAGSSIPAYEARRRRRDGALLDVSVSLAPIQGAGDEIVGVLGIFHEITGHKRVEARLERLNAVLFAIREVNQIVVRERDPDRLLEEICDSLLRTQGYSKAWIAVRDGAGRLGLRAMAGLRRYRAAFAERLDAGPAPTCIQRALEAPGVCRIEDRAVSCRGCPLEQAYPDNEALHARLEHGGVVMGVLGLSLPQDRGIIEEEWDLVSGIASDIALALHGFEAEAQARLQREQLMQADKMVALGTLVSGIGHEINNPNNFVMLNMPLIKGAWESALPVLEAHHREQGELRLRGMPFPQARELIPQLLDDILEGAWRIKRIVGELKDYARQQPTAYDERVEVNQAVRSAITLCQTFIKQRTRRFSVDYGDGLPRVRGSRQRIEQVVINLLQNACEALEDCRGAVAIRTAFDGDLDRVVVTVTDEGRGIAAADLPHISDPFFTTKRSSGGTGLGLSIADRIVSDHGGALAFESRPGEGTVARMLLPRVDAEARGGAE